MSLQDVQNLLPAAHRLVPSVPWGNEASVLLLAICGQESGWQNVQQAAGGPAKGYPQFEVEAIRELLENGASAHAALQAVQLSGILDSGPGASSVSAGAMTGAPLDSPSRLAAVVWTKFLNFPALQLALARLMLWDNPNDLPPLGDCNGAWLYYTQTWRPGKPRPADWAANYHASLSAMTGNPSDPTGPT